VLSSWREEDDEFKESLGSGNIKTLSQKQNASKGVGIIF
jgi:hypothetical protein